MAISDCVSWKPLLKGSAQGSQEGREPAQAVARELTASSAKPTPATSSHQRARSAAAPRPGTAARSRSRTAPWRRRNPAPRAAAMPGERQQPERLDESQEALAQLASRAAPHSSRRTVSTSTRDSSDTWKFRPARRSQRRLPLTVCPRPGTSTSSSSSIASASSAPRGALHHPCRDREDDRGARRADQA